MIGLQVGAVSFFDEGVGQVLDTLQERGGGQHHFSHDFTYGRGLAGRQIPGHRSPSRETGIRRKLFPRGKLRHAASGIVANTILKKHVAPDHGASDILQMVLPEAKKRGLKVLCSCEDVFSLLGANVKQVVEWISKGARRARCACSTPKCALLDGPRHRLLQVLRCGWDFVLQRAQTGRSHALGASHAQSIAPRGVPAFVNFTNRRPRSAASIFNAPGKVIQAG